MLGLRHFGRSNVSFSGKSMLSKLFYEKFMIIFGLSNGSIPLYFGLTI